MLMSKAIFIIKNFKKEHVICHHHAVIIYKITNLTRPIVHCSSPLIARDISKNYVLNAFADIIRQ